MPIRFEWDPAKNDGNQRKHGLRFEDAKSIFVWETDRWSVQLNGKNLTDERYFRSNFPNLFGSQVVLPELPRNFQARIAYKF